MEGKKRIRKKCWMFERKKWMQQALRYSFDKWTVEENLQKLFSISVGRWICFSSYWDFDEEII